MNETGDDRSQRAKIKGHGTRKTTNWTKDSLQLQSLQHIIASFHWKESNKRITEEKDALKLPDFLTHQRILNVMGALPGICYSYITQITHITCHSLTGDTKQWDILLSLTVWPVGLFLLFLLLFLMLQLQHPDPRNVRRKQEHPFIKGMKEIVLVHSVPPVPGSQSC